MQSQMPIVSAAGVQLRAASGRSDGVHHRDVLFFAVAITVAVIYFLL